jgi:hypothetical protein
MVITSLISLKGIRSSAGVMKLAAIISSADYEAATTTFGLKFL